MTGLTHSTALVQSTQMAPEFPPKPQQYILTPEAVDHFPASVLSHPCATNGGLILLLCVVGYANRIEADGTEPSATAIADMFRTVVKECNWEDDDLRMFSIDMEQMFDDCYVDLCEMTFDFETDGLHLVHDLTLTNIPQA